MYVNIFMFIFILFHMDKEYKIPYGFEEMSSWKVAIIAIFKNNIK